MDTDRLVFGLIGVALGFGLGFLTALRRSHQQVMLARLAAKAASENTAHLMETTLNDSPGEDS